ncbi:hypothetical protein CRUP_023771 [Coryphaenoides rupestris]|nr:hypothetical protein CRUP_023771 [Coryphaenoides rupestris]
MSSTGGRRLKQWLIEQIQSSQYLGLQWEDDSHTMFRIPWKHAGKQDYNQEVDASIFKAWAVFKGKFKEGDKAEPATWKTRLRCALNKSPDFEEVTDRSQLDISEPYKATNDDYPAAVKRSHSPPEDGCSAHASPEYWSHGSITGPLTCVLIQLSSSGRWRAGYGCDAMQSVHFPPAELIEQERQRHVTCKLLGHLERGVLVRANREGVFIKRLCQSRVFWCGLGREAGPAHHGPVACKLERDAVVKIFDTSRFLQALQLHQDGQIPTPDPTITLCFGEELHDLTAAKNKLILVQITPMNCQQLLEAVNMRRVQSYSHSPSVEMSDEMASDQMARIYQDLCSYSAPQRADCYRDNMSITA